MISGYHIDMRQKVSTILDEGLYRRAKLESIRQGRPLSDILGEALESYLLEKKSPGGLGGIVSSTWGSVRSSPGVVRRLMQEEDDLFEA